MLNAEVGLDAATQFAIAMDGGKVVSAKKGTFSGPAARLVEADVEADGEGVHIESRAFFVERRLYQVMCTYPKSWTSPCKTFFDSFELIAPAGG